MQQFSRKKEKKRKKRGERDRAVMLTAGDSLLLYIFGLVKMYLYLFV